VVGAVLFKDFVVFMGELFYITPDPGL
jgi:hypothetical protein